MELYIGGRNTTMSTGPIYSISEEDEVLDVLLRIMPRLKGKYKFVIKYRDRNGLREACNRCLAIGVSFKANGLDLIVHTGEMKWNG